MNKPYEYFTDLAKKIREEIAELKHKLFAEKPKSETASTDSPRHYTINAIHKNEQSEQENDESVIATLNLPPAIRVDAQTEERNKPILKDRPTLLQIGTIVVAVVVAIIYGWQLRVMQKQLIEAKSATKLSQRPWLGLDEVNNGLETSPLKFDDHGNALLNYVARVKNFGQYGAQNVAFYPILLLSDKASDAQSQEDAACKVFIDERFGYLLFPGIARAVESHPLFQDKQQFSLDKKGGASAWISGCIFYKDQFGYRYHTKVIYSMVSPVDRRTPVVFPPMVNSEVNGVFVLFHSSMDTPDYTKSPQ
jgi:hypothetical protein